MKIFSNSVIETEKIGKNLAATLKGDEVIALYGDLGVGKTAFTRGIADYFGVKNEVSSPTFAIVNEYTSEKVRICHFDMYRIKTFEDLESAGFFDYIGKNILIIEWSENIEKYLPKNIIKVEINKVDSKNDNTENQRVINIEGATTCENIGG